MPALIEDTAELRKRPDFEVWTLTLDRGSYYDKIREFMRKAGLNRRTGIPVLWHGPDDDACGAPEWHTSAVPTGVLINPQGVVAYTRGGGIALSTVEFLMENPDFRLPVLDSQWVLNEDRTVDVSVQAYSPDRTPLECSVDTNVQVWFVYDRETKEYDWQLDGVRDPDKHYNGCGFQSWDLGLPESVVIEVDEFGYGSYSFTLPAVEGYYSGVNYQLTTLVTGTAEIPGGWNMSVRTRGTAHYPRDEEQAEE